MIPGVPEVVEPVAIETEAAAASPSTEAAAQPAEKVVFDELGSKYAGYFCIRHIWQYEILAIIFACPDDLLDGCN